MSRKHYVKNVTKSGQKSYSKPSVNRSNKIYTYTENSKEKRQHKNSCVYYNKSDQKCNNKKCSVTICLTAHNCTCYKRKEKEIKNSLSQYDETYLQLPYKSSIHESDNRYIGMSKNIGTPVHGTYLKSDGHRRHKARCIYYDKIRKICKWLVGKCIGSSHCNKYEEHKEE